MSKSFVAFRAMAAGLLASGAVLPGLAMAEAVTIKHAKGELTLETAPKRVAVFDLASLDAIDALGLDVVAGLPKGEDGSTNVPAYLSAYAKGPQKGIGTLFEPDFAALKELQPDLILIAGRSAGAYEALAALAPTADMSPSGKDVLADAIATTTTLGQIFRVEEKAEAEVAELNAAVAAMRAAAPKDKAALVLFAIGENSMVHAPGARFGTVYDFIGLPSVMAPLDPNAPVKPRPEPGSPEAAAAKKAQVEARNAALAEDPDWLITLDRGAISQEASDIAVRLAQDETVTATTAWKEGQVYHLDPRGWYIVTNGPQNLIQTATALTELFKAKP